MSKPLGKTSVMDKRLIRFLEVRRVEDLVVWKDQILVFFLLGVRHMTLLVEYMASFRSSLKMKMSLVLLVLLKSNGIKTKHKGHYQTIFAFLWSPMTFY